MEVGGSRGQEGSSDRGNKIEPRAWPVGWCGDVKIEAGEEGPSFVPSGGVGALS